MLRGVAAAAIAAALLASGSVRADPSIEAVRQGAAVAIDARATVRAPAALIWQTLTDYERLPQFVPGIQSSRVLRRDGPSTVVHQQGEAGFLVFSYSLDVVVESREQPPDTISVRLISGNLKQLAGGYRIEPGPAAGFFVLRWRGLIEPTSLPPLIGVVLLRHAVGEQFLGMVREIERREALRLQQEGRE
jgi:ribosome-associated toxin RatA of RatAB toxin-antitoxin module